MICYVHCQQEASVEVVEVEVADLAEVVVEVEAADLAEVEEAVDEEEVEVGFPIITIFNYTYYHMCCTCACLSSNHMMENEIFNFMGADLSVNKHLSLN